MATLRKTVRRVILALCNLCVAVTISGCSSMPPNRQLMPYTSPVPAGVRGTIKTVGTNCKYYFLGVLPVTTSQNLFDAMEEAKEKADVDVLTDVAIDDFGGYYILFSNSCVRVSGKGITREALEKAMEKIDSHVRTSYSDYEPRTIQ